MNEFTPKQRAEVEQGEPVLDRIKIISRMQQLGIDIELEDFEGCDDNDVLGIIASHAIFHDFDTEEVLSFTVPLESWED